MKLSSKKKQVFSWVLILGFLLAACGPAKPQNPDLILATTTSTQDSGLLDELIPVFQQETGYVVSAGAASTASSQ